MSYEDLVETRAKRIVKDANRAAKGKGKRGRKRKSSTLEAEEDIAEEDTAETARRGRKRKSAALDAHAPAPASALVMQASRAQMTDNEIAPEPQRAPIARMW
jgi:hypothetical protein